MTGFTTNWIHPIGAASVWMVCLSMAIAADETSTVDRRPTFQPVGDWSCVLSGQEITFCYRVAGIEGATVHVDWTLIGGHRTIARGAADPVVQRAEESPTIAVVIRMPTVRSGVILPVELRLTFAADTASHMIRRPMHVFSADPFHGNRALLSRFPIQLFDVGGATASLLDDNDLPYDRLSTIDSIDAIRYGMLLVGEGTSFQEHRGLAASLIQAAGRGVTVIVLAPAMDGASLAGVGELENEVLRSTRMEREDVLRRFDKRFDTVEWVPGRSVSAAISLQVDRRGPVFRMADDAHGWPWLELGFASSDGEDSRGRLIVCGFGIVKYWQDTPIPRYLFAHLLHDVVSSHGD